MHIQFLFGAAAAGILLSHGLQSTHAYDTEQVATERGNVPLYLPSNPDPNASLPLIVSLHGYTGNGSQHENYFKLRNEIDDRQFMLCVPDGTTNGSGDRFWEATDYCCDFGNQRPDDSSYLRGLIETIIADYPVDLDSIHVVGHSNGGFMSYRMACDHADLIASIGSLAGATFANPAACSPSEPVHVLQIHGTADTVIQFEGRCFFFFCYPGALESIQIWAQYNQCGNGSQSGEALDLVGNIAGQETSRTVLNEGCEETGTCELWAVNGGDHGPSFNANFRRGLIDWLLTHRKPAAVDPCAADFTEDEDVDGADLTELIAVWGGNSPVHDLDGDGTVGGEDLSIFLSAWGPCPTG
ncbi:MAG: alpha/beta fold hydrolase [Planctomycetota bacterium]|nr:alpha/beta fold hydrolase [Planctomycetota bacterium]